MVAITGDGGFNMMLGELETARRMGLTFTVVVVNNAASGYVKALQHLMYGPGAYHASDLAETNYARAAEALGCRGIRVEQPGDLAAALREGLSGTGPTIVDLAEVTAMRLGEPEIVLADTITSLHHEAVGAVLVSGSHGGRYPGYLAARAGVRAAILNDAGIGRDEAGIGSLAYLEALGIAAATVSHLSCLIGDTQDMLEHGLISRANGRAQRVGVFEGCPCRDAATLLKAASHASGEAPSIGEARRELDVAGSRRRVWLLDSASLVRPEDAGAIVVTGSHGGLIGGDPSLALRTQAHTAVFNDAGRPDGPGVSRLPVLAARGIAALTVSAQSARIGDATSTFHDGIVSAANAAAIALGARPGEPLAAWVTRTARIDQEPCQKSQ